MTSAEGFKGIPDYVPDVETLFDIADMRKVVGHDFLLGLFEGIAEGKGFSDKYDSAPLETDAIMPEETL
jgi:hypothetical protein